MEKTGNFKEGHNCLIVSLSGDQTFVKIFNSEGKILRHSRTKGETKIQQMAVQGTYKVETDGTIKLLSSTKIEAGIDPTQP